MKNKIVINNNYTIVVEDKNKKFIELLERNKLVRKASNGEYKLTKIGLVWFLGEKKLYEEELADKDMPSFNDKDILIAITSEDPYVALKDVFERDFFPKVIRWINKKIKNVKVNEEDKNKIGGEFASKLKKYLELDKGRVIFEKNALILVRELISAIEKWYSYENKPYDLPGGDNV